MDTSNQKPPSAQIKLTPDMMKAFKTLTCDCGGQLFKPGIVFKKVSALIAPSGNEELYPLEVIICQKCGKVPNELNPQGVLPESVLAEKQEEFKLQEPNEKRMPPTSNLKIT